MATKAASKRPRSRAKSDQAVSYDEWKHYEGQFYKGMKVGRGHKWYYDKGEWKDKKITPDLWQINYAVTKRRAGHAPEGSGAPVGTEYHWYIVAHQMVRKLNADDYTTSMSGLKYKVAHKSMSTGKWSATAKTQRKRMIQFLKEVIEDLETQQEEEITMESNGAASATKTKPEKTSGNGSVKSLAKRKKRVNENGSGNKRVKAAAKRPSRS